MGRVLDRRRLEVEKSRSQDSYTAPVPPHLGTFLAALTSTFYITTTKILTLLVQLLLFTVGWVLGMRKPSQR